MILFNNVSGGIILFSEDGHFVSVLGSVNEADQPLTSNDHISFQINSLPFEQPIISVPFGDTGVILDFLLPDSNTTT